MFEFLFKKNKHLTFGKGGVHPEEYKELSCTIPIQYFTSPKKVQLHLQQGLCPAANATVKRGDIVKRGQIVAEASGDGVPVHSSIYGKVVNVGKAAHPSQVEGAVVIIESLPVPNSEIEGVPAPTSLDFPEDSNWQNLDKEEMLGRIRNAGIVGLGGAAFPTYKKLNVPSQFKIDTLVINGAECEPYLTCDHRLMLEKSEEMIWGCWLISKIIQVHKIAIGIEDNKLDAVEQLKKVISQIDFGKTVHPVEIKVFVTHTRYPQGSEKHLVQALTNRIIPFRKLPMDVGVVVQNVATASAVYDAIKYNKPLMDRIVTMTGEGIIKPQNVRVPLGTNLEEIVHFCGGIKDNVVKVINGGPMMGRTIPTLEMPVIKGTNGFIFMTENETHLGEYDPCIMCGKCIEVCPLGLEPNRISMLVESGHPLQTAQFGTQECFECGSCSYICPSKRPLVQFIQVSKSAYRKEAQIIKENILSKREA